MGGFLNRQNEAKQIADESAAIAFQASAFLEDAGAVRAPGEAALFLARADFLIRRAESLMERIREDVDGSGMLTEVPAPEAGGLEAAVAAQQAAALDETLGHLETMRRSLEELAGADETVLSVRAEIDRLHLEAGLMETTREGDKSREQLLRKLEAGLSQAACGEDKSGQQLLEKLRAGLEAERRRYE